MAGRRQHFIPQFLLKGFATRRGQRNPVWRTWVHQAGHVPRKANIKEVAAERDFYGEAEDTTLDDEITARETHYAEVLAQIRAGSAISDALGNDLRRVIVHLMLRNYSTRHALQSGLAQGIGMLSRVVESTEVLESALRRAVHPADPMIAELIAQGERTSGRRLSREQRARLIRQARDSVQSRAKEMATNLVNQSKGARLAVMPEFDRFAANAHRKALRRALEPERRVEQLGGFQLAVCSTTKESPFILGDCAVVGLASTNLCAIDPLSPISDMAAVCLPISPTQAVIAFDGGLNAMPVPIHIIEATARLSRQFFVSVASDQTSQKLSGLIGTAPDVFSALDWSRIEAELKAEVLGGA